MNSALPLSEQLFMCQQDAITQNISHRLEQPPILVFIFLYFMEPLILFYFHLAEFLCYWFSIAAILCFAYAIYLNEYMLQTYYSYENKFVILQNTFKDELLDYSTFYNLQYKCIARATLCQFDSVCQFLLSEHIFLLRFPSS